MLSKAIFEIRIILKDAQHNLPVDFAVIIEGAYADIISINHFINKELELIENDEELNDIDKSNAKRMIFEQAGRKLEVLKEKINYSSKIENIEEKCSDENAEDDPTLKFIREKEIRDRLVGMTERQIISHFGDSLFDGSNPLMVDAILNAPPGFEILTEEELEKIRAIRAKKKSPKIPAEIDLSRKVDSTMSQMVSLFKKELNEARKNEISAGFYEKNI